MNIGLMLFGMRDDFKKILAKMASDYIGPAGAIPFERLVARHLGAFQELRGHGLTWEQISRLLAGSGILRGDGRALSSSHLRGVFGRQHKRAAASCPVRPHENVAAAVASRIPPARPSQNGFGRARIARPTIVDPGEPTFAGLAAPIDPPSADAGSISGISGSHRQGDDNANHRPAANTPHRDRTDVLALMRQAALARRSG